MTFIKGHPSFVTEASRKKQSETMKKKPSWNDGSEKALKRIEQVRKMGLKYGKRPKTIEQRIKVSLSLIKIKSLYRKGGLTEEYDRIRHSWRYKMWKKSVLERDGYKCVQCGGIESLQVDHIKEFAWYPELRFDVNNGRVLCYECHRKTDTWGPRYRSCSLSISE